MKNEVSDTDDETKSYDTLPTTALAPVYGNECAKRIVESTMRMMKIKPESYSRLEGPLYEVTKVDDQTADVKIIHGFRAHFKQNSRRQICDKEDEGDRHQEANSFGNCLVPAPGEKIKNRVLRRGSLSFSDLSIFEDPSQTKSMIIKEGSLSCPWEINPNDIQLGRRIAIGGFAEVFIGTYQDLAVAVKRLLDHDAAAIDQFRSEVSILARLRHPNLILFMGYCCTPELSIIYEFMQKGSLYNILRLHEEQALEDHYIAMVLISVARGMIYLHTRSPPILHLDLKSPNILIDNAWNVKITDFGLSRLRCCSFVSGNNGAHGTPHWMAPEWIRGEKVNEKADVYSFGVIIWELLTGKIPWGHLNAIQVIAAVGFKQKQLPRPQHPDQTLIALMEDCLAPNPSDRPNFHDIFRILDQHYTAKLEKQTPKVKLIAGPSEDCGKDMSSEGFIRSLMEVPDSQSFRIGTEKVDQEEPKHENGYLDKLIKFEQSLKDSDQHKLSPNHDARPIIAPLSPFSQFADTPIVDGEQETDPSESEDGEEEMKRMELSHNDGDDGKQNQVTLATVYATPFAAFASQPFATQFSNEASSSQSSPCTSLAETTLAVRNEPSSGQQLALSQLSQKRQLSLLLNSINEGNGTNCEVLAELGVPVEHAVAHYVVDGNAVATEGTEQISEPSFFHVNNQDSTMGWRIKVAEIEGDKATENISKADEVPVVTQDEELAPVTSLSGTECSGGEGSGDWEDLELWNLNDTLDNDNDEYETQPSSMSMIPPMSFASERGGVHHQP